MIYDLNLQSEAIADIHESFEWYESRRPGLGYTFVDEIEICFSKITTFPLHYSSVNSRFRRIKVKRFPFVIVYEIEDNKIFVTGVRHTGRQPDENDVLAT